MQVKDVMTTNVITVSPDVSIVDVAKLIAKNRFHGVPVVEKGKPVGIITESDFFTKDSIDLHLPSYVQFLKQTGAVTATSDKQKDKIKELMNIKARDIMTPNCITLSPEMEVGEVINSFKEKKVNTFPVVDGEGNLAGIITLIDVINLI
jgi:CBS domain-containing protein